MWPTGWQELARLPIGSGCQQQAGRSLQDFLLGLLWHLAGSSCGTGQSVASPTALGDDSKQGLLWGLWMAAHPRLMLGNAGQCWAVLGRRLGLSWATRGKVLTGHALASLGLVTWLSRANASLISSWNLGRLDTGGPYLQLVPAEETTRKTLAATG
uniref:Uncharacterized protein n=1 Tax=Acrobeloides nanus TaxID=290746 RepID=A0A914CK15_9BILA